MAVFFCAPRSAGLARAHAAEAQHGHCRQRLASSGVGSGSRHRHTALLAPRRACGSAGHRVFVGRPGDLGRLRSIWTQSIDFPGTKPWKISFSYGRALQDHALETWHGRDENLAAARASAVTNAPAVTVRQVSAGTPDEMENTQASVASHAASPGMARRLIEATPKVEFDGGRANLKPE